MQPRIPENQDFVNIQTSKLLKKNVHYLRQNESFLTKSSFKNFFHQESFAMVHIDTRNTLEGISMKYNIIGRFKILPAEIGQVKL